MAKEGKKGGRGALRLLLLRFPLGSLLSERTPHSRSGSAPQRSSRPFILLISLSMAQHQASSGQRGRVQRSANAFNRCGWPNLLLLALALLLVLPLHSIADSPKVISSTYRKLETSVLRSTFSLVRPPPPTHSNHERIRRWSALPFRGLPDLLCPFGVFNLIFLKKKPRIWLDEPRGRIFSTFVVSREFRRACEQKPFQPPAIPVKKIL